MTDTPQPKAEDRPSDGFAKGLSSTVAKRLVAPLITTAATAVTAYLTRKAGEVWRETLLPKLQEKGGVRAAAREALELVAGKLDGRGSNAFAVLAEKLADDGDGTTRRSQSSAVSREDEAPKGARDEERQQRKQRREQRQRALDQST